MREVPGLVQGAPESTGSQGGEIRFSRPDGSIRWSFAAGQLIRQENPRPMRFTGVFLDITERKKADEQQTLLMREVDHRAKNLLAVVQSMLNLSKAETTIHHRRQRPHQGLSWPIPRCRKAAGRAWNRAPGEEETALGAAGAADRFRAPPVSCSPRRRSASP
jgi:hypothetical protein